MEKVIITNKEVQLSYDTFKTITRTNNMYKAWKSTFKWNGSTWELREGETKEEVAEWLGQYTTKLSSNGYITLFEVEVK